jgi:hypothetical protein
VPVRLVVSAAAVLAAVRRLRREGMMRCKDCMYRIRRGKCTGECKVYTI